MSASGSGIPFAPGVYDTIEAIGGNSRDASTVKWVILNLNDSFDKVEIDKDGIYDAGDKIKEVDDGEAWNAFINAMKSRQSKAKPPNSKLYPPTRAGVYYCYEKKNSKGHKIWVNFVHEDSDPSIKMTWSTCRDQLRQQCRTVNQKSVLLDETDSVEYSDFLREANIRL